MTTVSRDRRSRPGWHPAHLALVAMAGLVTEDLAGRLPIGSPAECLDLLGRYRLAGLQRIVVWPMRDEVERLERIAQDVMPYV